MSIKLNLPDMSDLRPRITVIGVGGAGGNAVNNMIRSGLEGCEFVAANTDAQALAMSSAAARIQIGVHITEGLGAGSKPDVGAAAAEEALDEIRNHLVGAHMLFITAGMGGGTGTGAAPVIARVAKEMGVLTVAVVTKPFEFEGQRRMRIANEGIAELSKHVDTIIVIPNQNLFRIATEKTTFADAFQRADDVLKSGVACITDLMVKEGLINLDFADVRVVMESMGTALMGTGEAEGDKRALHAAEAAISNPLLDDVTMRGAKGLLISITGSGDMTLYEVEQAASRIRKEVDPESNPDVNIIVGATFEADLVGKIRVSVVATGIQTGPVPPHATTQRDEGGKKDQKLSDRLQAAGGQGRGGDARMARDARPEPRAEDGRGGHASQGGGHQGNSGLGSAGLGSGGLGSGGLGTAVPSGGHGGNQNGASGAQAWHGSGNVTIEPKPRKPAPQQVPPPRQPAPPAPPERGMFEPQAPLKPIRPPRRPLTGDDFPELAQREAELRRRDPHGGQKPSGRRGGFLDWMTGRSRSRSSSDPGDDSSEGGGPARGGGSGAARPSPGSRPSSASSGGNSVVHHLGGLRAAPSRPADQAPARGALSPERRSGPDQGEEPFDIPDFFRRPLS
jgi:cell division protein FtsZ